MTPSNLLPGTLDMLVLEAVSLGAEHGYDVLLRIQRASRGALTVEQGALYPALFRLESQGLVAAERGLVASTDSRWIERLRRYWRSATSEAPRRLECLRRQ